VSDGRFQPIGDLFGLFAQNGIVKDFELLIRKIGQSGGWARLNWLIDCHITQMILSLLDCYRVDIARGYDLTTWNFGR
jgi:hypothetical protein